MTMKQMWDYLIMEGIATYDELCLVTSKKKKKKETMLDVLYARTGYRNFEQLETE